MTPSLPALGARWYRGALPPLGSSEAPSWRVTCRRGTYSSRAIKGSLHCLVPQATQPGQLDQRPQGPGTPDDPSGLARAPGMSMRQVHGEDVTPVPRLQGRRGMAPLGSTAGMPRSPLPSQASDSTSGSSLSKRPVRDQGLPYKAMERAGASWGRDPFSSWWCQTWN